MDQEKSVGDLLPKLQRTMNGGEIGSMGHSEITERHVIRFYTRMKHLFGHKWSATYSENATDQTGKITPAAQHWLYDLRDFTPEQVSQGLSKVEQQAGEWPPSPMEFKKLCMGVPTIDEVLDRKNDYGPICGAIRSKMDWWNLDGMPTKHMIQESIRQYHQAITNLSRSGQMHRLSLSAASRLPSISDESE